jgi:hypothetical protein
VHVICLSCGTAYERRPSVAGKYCSRSCASTSRRGIETPVEDRFFRHVEKTTSCWLWTGYIDSGGYGTIQIGHAPWLVHRVSYELHHGPIPPAAVVRHSCDVRHCVNPDHLLVGTPKENTADMIERGRAAVGEKNAAYRHPERRPRGENHGNAKLSDAAIAEVRSLYTGNRGEITRLAERFGVSISNISQIVRNLTRV